MWEFVVSLWQHEARTTMKTLFNAISQSGFFVVNPWNNIICEVEFFWRSASDFINCHANNVSFQDFSGYFRVKLSVSPIRRGKDITHIEGFKVLNDALLISCSWKLMIPHKNETGLKLVFDYAFELLDNAICVLRRRHYALKFILKQSNTVSNVMMNLWRNHRVWAIECSINVGC